MLALSRTEFQADRGVVRACHSPVLRPPRHRGLLCWGTLLTVMAALLAGCHGKDPGGDSTQVRRGAAAIEGIPQDGFTLGRAEASWELSVISPATSLELDQLITQLPAVTEQFVRSGRINVQMRTPSTGAYGGNGEARVADGVLLAAGLQGRYWDALVRLVPVYRGGLEADDLAALLKRSGVDNVRLAMTERSGPRVGAELVRADAAAAAAGGNGRLLYILTPPDGAPRNLTPDVDQGRLAGAIARELALSPADVTGP